MTDFFELLLMLGSVSSKDASRTFFSFCRVMMLLVFSAFLYKEWVGEFEIANSANSIAEYFMSGRFMYSALIYLFVTFCEMLVIGLFTKLNAIIIVSKALKLVDEIKSERRKMTSLDKEGIRGGVDVLLKMSIGRFLNWVGDEYEHDKILRAFIPTKTKKLKIYPERMDGLSTFAIEVYVYMLCTGHDWKWFFLLFLTIPVFAILKAFLLLLKHALPVLRDAYEIDPNQTDLFQKN